MRILLALAACLIWGGYLFADDGGTIQSPNNTNAANQPDDKNVYIREIKIYGNATTRPEVLKTLFTFDTGEVLDTSKLRATRENLLGTQLYDKVDIFPHTREDGAHVFVVLKEAVRLQLGYGVKYGTRMHGQDNLWFWLTVDAGFSNFRGRFEEFWFGVSAWEHKSLEVEWYKPLLSTPYYLSTGAGAASYPDFALPIDYVDLYSKFTFGRALSKNSRLSLSAIPIYRRQTIIGPDVSHIPEAFQPNQYEAFAAAAFTTDRRSARFDPKSGWLLQSQLRTNRLYSGVNTPFFQLTSEFRGYMPLPQGDLAVARVQHTLRDTDAGKYHRLTYGGAGQIRGYGEDVLGWNFVANSSILASAKYHKRLYETPPLPASFVNLVFTGVKNIHFKFDATFIADYALLYGDNLGALAFRGPWQDGAGIGFGTRIMAPEIRQSGCIDLVFGKVDNPEGEGYTWSPTLHVYLDLFF